MSPSQLAELFTGASPSLPTMREIATLVAERHRVKLEDLRGRSHRYSIAWPRQEAMALIHAQGRYSLSQIGRFFDRDHSTVMHGIRRHAERLAQARARAA